MLGQGLLHFRKFCFLCSLLGAIGFTLGVIDEVSAAKQKKVDVAEQEHSPTDGGCRLEMDKPFPPNKIPPCETGVPSTGPHVFACESVGSHPNKTCHWIYEDTLGCDNGGYGKMCDTVAVPGGTDCKCRTLP